MSELNWKSKYQELKVKFMNAVDASYRIGFEQGAQQAQMQAQQEQMQAQAEADAAAAAGGQPGQPGQPGQEGGEEQQQQPGSENPQGSELDQHISTLEGMISKSEIKPEDLVELKKSLEDLKLNRELKKSDAAIQGIAKALNRPNKVFKMSPTASHNLPSKAKSALSMQERIVADMMKTWKEEESRAGADILDVLRQEGVVKKD